MFCMCALPWNSCWINTGNAPALFSPIFRQTKTWGDKFINGTMLTYIGVNVNIGATMASNNIGSH